MLIESITGISSYIDRVHTESGKSGKSGKMTFFWGKSGISGKNQVISASFGKNQVKVSSY